VNLYANRALITARDLAYTDANRVSTFDPLDEHRLRDMREWLGFDAVAIAMNDFGDSVYLRPDSTESDIVYVTHHDGGDIEVFAESVPAMVNRLRDANRNL
jgi:hypothetical protein